MMWAWFEGVKQAYPRNQLMLYSRKELLDKIKMTAAEAAYFRQIPTWTAGYPNNPDLFDSPPPAYIPDPLKFGKVWLWQYSEDAIIEGINGEVDVNWIAPELIAWLGAPIPPPIEENETMKGKVIVSKMNVRASPSTSAADVGDLFLGQTITAGTENAGWWQIQEVDGIPKYVGNWAAQLYNGVQYIEPIVEPPAGGKPVIHVKLTADGYPDFEADWSPL
jgi:hypothetical protein